VERRTGPIVGWRAWRVATSREGLRLRSAVYDDEWPPGVEIAARCAHDGHAAPAIGCACGIYAARDPAEAVRYLVGRDDTDVVHRVVGLVALTGVVVEHTRGWRAERGVAARLWVPAADTNGEAAPVAEVVAGLRAYSVRVELVPAFAPAAVAAAMDESSRIRHGRVSHVCGPRRYARA
jgi:hypothetical protein